MSKLVICRHGESTWNLENRFTGWTDVSLSKNGIIEAKNCGKILKNKKYNFDLVFTSLLSRAYDTLLYCLKEMGNEGIEVIRDWRLNERHYGSLQGLNKIETVQKFGEKQVLDWRRGFSTTPPKLSIKNKTHPIFDKKYSNIKKSELPSSESLKDVVNRFMPLWTEIILKNIKIGKSILIVAHGNSLRALYKIVKKISDRDIVKFNIPTGIPMVLEFDKNYNLIDDFYLGDQKVILEKINSVKNQTTTKEKFK